MTFVFDTTVSVDAVFTLLALIGAFIGFFVNQRKQLALRRAELMRHYEDKFGTLEMQETFQNIDYDRLDPVLDKEGTWIGERGELELVRLLDLFNTVGHNWSANTLKLEDVSETALGYGIARTYRSDAVQAYLANVDATDEIHAYGLNQAWRHFRALGAALTRGRALPTPDPVERAPGADGSGSASGPSV